MSDSRSMSKNIEIYDHDIPSDYYDRIHNAKIVAWDIETSGLDWHNDRIGTCQLHTPDESVAIVKCSNIIPEKLKSLLSDASVKKVFHHAMFDLRFMSYHWDVSPNRVACTKIAAKLLDVENINNHTLKSLLKTYLDVSIDKNEQVSNWLADDLTDDQISYAARDVQYLLHLLNVLERQLEIKGLQSFAHSCFDHIPTRLRLDILGYGDIYSY